LATPDYVADIAASLWPEQAAFVADDDNRIVMLAGGAGYGKTEALVLKGLKHYAEQDGWWERCDNWRETPLDILFGGPHNSYLTGRLIPAHRGMIGGWEQALGRQLTKRTGRHRNGFFDSGQARRLEMANGVTYHYRPLDKEESAVASNVCGLFIDEATMLKSQGIWTRSTMRVRDPRANSLLIACTGTPEVGHFLYEEFFDSVTGAPQKDRKVYTDSSLNNPLLADDYFGRFANASEAFIDMQIKGLWTRGSGGERFAHLFKPDIHFARMDIPLDRPNMDFVIGWDPGYATGGVVIMLHKPSIGKWLVVHEIPILGATTREVCRIIRGLGLHANRNNIKYIGGDPNDFNKRRSSSDKASLTDAKIIFEELGVRPRYDDPHVFNRSVRLRNDVLADMLQSGGILFNETLRPKHPKAPGVINSILNYSLVQADKEDDQKFLDKPTNITNKLWKHFIDAIHYGLMHSETGIYRRLKVNSSRRK